MRLIALRILIVISQVFKGDTMMNTPGRQLGIKEKMISYLFNAFILQKRSLPLGG